MEINDFEWFAELSDGSTFSFYYTDQNVNPLLTNTPDFEDPNDNTLWVFDTDHKSKLLRKSKLDDSLKQVKKNHIIRVFSKPHKTLELGLGTGLTIINGF